MTDRELHRAPLRTHWDGCEEVHPECKKPRREWVGLTDEEIYKIDCLLITNITELVIAIETKLKEKNNV
jgi:hypothetical protein